MNIIISHCTHDKYTSTSKTAIRDVHQIRPG